MSEAPGIPRVIGIYWILMGGMLLLLGVAHGLAMLPVLAGAYYLNPATLDYGVYAGIGWVVLYMADTVRLIRYNPTEELMGVLDNIGVGLKLAIAALVGIVVNTSVGVAIISAYGVSLYFGAPLLGYLIALVYPNLELRGAAKGWPVPSVLVLKIILGLVHTIGKLQDVTAEGVINGMSSLPNQRSGASPA